MSQSTSKALSASDQANASTAARAAALLYGGVVYAIFFITFCYAIAFVGGIIVPYTIDSGTAGPISTALLVNAGLLGLFAVQHNIMARQWFKKRWTKIVPEPVERSTFVLATCLILITMYLAWQPIPGVVWSVESPIGKAVLWSIFGLGWTLVLVSTFLIDHFELFGLRQVVRYAKGDTFTPPKFQVRSLYRYVRHPLYVGFFLGMWVTPHMTWGHLFFAAMCGAFMRWSIILEERDLVRAHGDDYRNYQQRVPALIPTPGRTY